MLSAVAATKAECPQGVYSEGGPGKCEDKPLTPLVSRQRFLSVPVGAGGVERRPEKPGINLVAVAPMFLPIPVT